MSAHAVLDEDLPPPENRLAGLLPQLVRHAVLILLIVLLLAPLVWLLMTAFKPYPELFLRPPEILPQNGTLVNFSEGWAVGGGKGIEDSLIVSSLSTLLCLLLGFPAAYALARRFSAARPAQLHHPVAAHDAADRAGDRFSTSCSSSSRCSTPIRASSSSTRS